MEKHIEIFEYNENMNINGFKKNGFWTETAVSHSLGWEVNINNDIYYELLAVVPDSYGLTFLQSSQYYGAFGASGQRYKEIWITRLGKDSTEF